MKEIERPVIDDRHERASRPDIVRPFAAMRRPCDPRTRAGDVSKTERAGGATPKVCRKIARIDGCQRLSRAALHYEKGPALFALIVRM
jgi:hypothetical protein